MDLNLYFSDIVFRVPVPSGPLSNFKTYCISVYYKAFFIFGDSSGDTFKRDLSDFLY
jgi:hypothetical protein